MATQTDAGVLAVTPQVWDTAVLQGRYGAAVTMPRVLNKSALVSDYGQIIHIPIKPRFAGGSVATDGTFVPESGTITDIQITVDQWKEVSIVITDKQAKQAIVTLETELPSQFGARLGEFSDIDLNNQFPNFTGGSETLVAGQGLGQPGTGIQFLEDTALSAVLLLRRRNIPMENMSWILSPECFYLGWLTKERLTNANSTGEDKSLLTTNFRQKILNIPAYESTLLNGSTSTNDAGALLNGPTAPNLTGTTLCALLHKESLGIAMQINNKYEKVRTTPALQLGTLIVNSNLYGVKTVRATHAVPIYVRNS